MLPHLQWEGWTASQPHPTKQVKASFTSSLTVRELPLNLGRICLRTHQSDGRHDDRRQSRPTLLSDITRVPSAVDSPR